MSNESREWQGFALRSCGEAIEEIGLRELDHKLTPDEIEAVRFLAGNVLAWCDANVEAVSV